MLLQQATFDDQRVAQICSNPRWASLASPGAFALLHKKWFQKLWASWDCQLQDILFPGPSRKPIVIFGYLWMILVSESTYKGWSHPVAIFSHSNRKNSPWVGSTAVLKPGIVGVNSEKLSIRMIASPMSTINKKTCCWGLTLVWVDKS